MRTGIHHDPIWAEKNDLGAVGGDPRWAVPCWPPLLALAWARGRCVARGVSGPLERVLLRAGASRPGPRARSLSTEASA